MFTRRELLAGCAAFAFTNTAWLPAQTAAPPRIQFNGTDYLFRWTNGRLFEFTPSGQEDLDRWNEMVTVLALRDMNSPDKLAGWANNVVTGYKDRHGLLRTNSVPATTQDPAQHFVAGILSSTGLVECIFNRFLLMHDVGYDFIYSHRNYGADMKQTATNAIDWAKANGAGVESAVMKFNSVPNMETLEHWKASLPASH